MLPEVAAVAAIAAVAFITVAYRKRWRWTGFIGDELAAEPKDRRPKTLWNWLDLLLVPVVLAAAGAVLNDAQSKREEAQAEERAKTDRAISLDAQRERTIQDYLTSMTALILERIL